MATSLAQQLKKLAAPESSAFKETKKKASLLFEPKVAASLDRETFYEIGISGFTELKKINPSFAIYEKTLFSPSSKDFERSVQTKDVNERLDKTIRSFLMKLSPYFLLQPAHKALEWLINRFQIHKYNKDDIFVLILPYHETKIFVRFLQIIRLGDATNFWHWLAPLKKPGIPLTKQVLFNHCISNLALLRFISDMTMTTIKEFGDNADILTTLFAFYCSTVVGTIEHIPVVSESLLTSILPGLLDSLSSPFVDVRAAGYIITGQLVTKVQLKKKIINHLINKIILFNTDLHYEAVLLLQLIFDTQHNISDISEKSFTNLTPNHMKMLCLNLNVLINNGSDTAKFLIAFLRGILPLVQKDGEYFKRFAKLPEILISEININGAAAKKIIKCAIDCYSMSKTDKDYDSDIEILDSTIEEKCSIQTWYSTLMKNIERKYPTEFDEVVKLELKTNKELSEDKIKALNDILGFAPKIMEKLGDTYLFEKLYHHNPDMRVEAVNFLISNYKKLLKADKQFLIESVNYRLADDNPEVVSAMLQLEVNYFIQIFRREVFVDHLTSVIKKGHSQIQWRKPASRALELLCVFDVDLDQHACLTILPYMFPINEDIDQAIKLLKSPLGTKITAFEDISMVFLTEDHKTISEVVLNAVEHSLWLPHSSSTVKLLNSISREDYVSALFIIILVSFDLKKHRASFENVNVLETIVTFTKSVDLTSIGDSVCLSGNTIGSFIETAAKSKLPIESVSYLFDILIKNTNVTLDMKPWIDFSNRSLDVDFILQIYEAALSDHFQPYRHFFSSVLKLLLNKCNSSNQEKIEFIANFVIKYLSLKSENIENESIKIRSLRILHVLIKNEDDLSWFYDSNILITTILLGLNSPEEIIRNITFEIVDAILNKSLENKNHCYFVFLNELVSRKEELVLDNNQLSLAIYTLLSPEASVKKILAKSLKKPMKDTMTSLINIILDDAIPYYVRADMVLIFSHVNSGDILTSLAPVALNLLDQIANMTSDVDIHRSCLLSNIISRINPSTLSASIENSSVWQLIETSLKCKNIIYDDGNNPLFVCVLMMKQIDEDFFKLLTLNKAQNIINLVLDVALYGSNAAITSAASKMIKRIELSSEQFLSILKSMETLTVHNIENKQIRKKVSTLSLSILDRKEWRIGVSLLEHIQSKKKLVGFENMLPALFGVLKKCLEFEEQSAVEYSKQLLLTSILNCCQRINPQITEKTTFKNIVDIELVILCIRGTQNPQTHHHALMLLAQIASMSPNQVLQYMMAIFTFIGSSILRQDDAYSFQIITKIIETIIPILVKCNDINELDDKKLAELESRVIPVLRIFVDAVLDIPEHRRLPLFKKLLETLSADHFIWMFLAILFEGHIIHGMQEKNIDEHKRKLSDKEQPVRRLDFAMSLVCEFSPETIMKNCLKLLLYLKNLPEDKPEGVEIHNANPNAIFSISNHNAKQLRHFKYTIVTFVNNLLSSQVFIHSVSVDADQSEMEQLYKTFIVNTLTYIQLVSRIADSNIGKPQAKYWKVMLHHCYEVLDNVNNLLTVEMFVTVIRGLMMHNLATVKRKAMELLNTKLQHNASFFADCDKELLFTVLDPLMGIIRDIEINEIPEGLSKQETELNQQTALLSLKMLVRLLSQDEPDTFKPILSYVTDLIKSTTISGNLQASLVLCLAELCSNLKAHAISSLPKFMPSLIKILKSQTSADTPELILLSVITAVYKIVETIPLFLSPYLEKLLYQLSILSAKWDDKSATKPTAIANKLSMIKQKISTTIQPRVLIPVISQCYSLLLRKENYDAIGPAMNMLADSFAGVTGPEFTSLQNDLTTFFISALQFRSDHADNTNVTDEQIEQIEEYIIKALVALVLKLSESSFRPLYFKIYDWSIRDMQGNNKERAITFYRLSSSIAEGLRGLFILFASHFVKNSVDLLDACNKSKTETLYFSSELKCSTLVEYIFKTLNSVFTHDSQNFVNKDKFETIMQPLVDQLDNTVSGTDALTKRAKDLIIPCIAQFAIATADDSLWKPLNYQILLKTRHNDAAIRLLGLECMREMATKLGDSWLPLLPESVPFLAELLEDEVQSVEAATQKAVQTLEAVLGEPLQKYF
ncbi:HEAT repeat containing 1 homolog l(2)k09022 [Arctopsyche grandis]|uniref:HEAT repeat containing 1 homolog l(2)k09022 n=1 Tax=Arctopsyche grandis TaxID=121162 RepID=UPI00406D857F